MYLVNNLELGEVPEMGTRLRQACWQNFLCSLPFLLLILGSLLFMRGFGIVDDRGTIEIVSFKYLRNLLANPWLIALLIAGLALVITGVWKTAKTTETGGIWYGGLGTVLVGLTVLLLPAYNNTAFYPSKVDLQSSLTIFNASSSPYTLKIMTYVALAIPFVLAYVAYVWRAMNRTKLKIEDTGDRAAY
jgi:cytochrome d ubiquinol oxidase subunit II